MHQLCRTLALAVLGAAFVVAVNPSTAVAQETVSVDSVYALSYYSNAHTTGAADGTLRLINDGNVSDSSPAGDLCASIYVFNNAEEMEGCCSCKITPNGLLTLSINNNLTTNNLTPGSLTRGVVKVLSTAPNGGWCSAAAGNLNPGIRGWMTHTQKSTGTSFSQTEEELTDASLGQAELADLQEDCGVLIELGSGFGVCSCRDAGR